MTWQGGKRHEPIHQTSPFAPLKPVTQAQPSSIEQALDSLAQSLTNLGKALRIHFQLVSGADDSYEHWEVLSGTKKTKTAKREPDDADMIVVTRPETLLEILQGKLPPYEAFHRGKLRVGGDTEIAKRVTKHLSDPAMAYVPPC